MTKETAALRDRMVTIGDIAKRAGVAPSTVSRALSNPDRVNAETREKIQKIAAELGYIPSPLARNLRMGSTGTIAVLVPDVSSPVSFQIVRGTQNQIKATGYTHVLINTEQAEDFELDVLRRLRRTADGAILGSSSLTDEQLAQLASLQPLVTFNRPTPGVSAVLIDTATAMGDAVSHLASLGHTSVTYVGGPSTSWSNAQRWQAIEAAAQKLDMSANRIGPYPGDKKSGAAAADEVLTVGSTSIIAFNDMLAIGILQRLSELGISVPADLSVVGCDDVMGADFCNPPLTTIASPIEQAGRMAVSILLDRMAAADGSAKPYTTTLPSELVVRASTGPARGPAR
ncbi:LacI family DNA-binding transcriptional regulator [Arthrobacter nitrophenolicus]|uniref:LacI family transcriptional regulator n=1 Tax=Arthrobacter nitrophenolicus TaxID=683150 RepID=A0A4R5Y7D4_9MICC|nr:LacI family DNA-binding transcriptional regulator [Arthrobacter nitrophenolicus]TDL39696.1 LacI family transcriptional regulator [Arthrobacter nitrophenolicus]